jgi:hypothetical protein
MEEERRAAALGHRRIGDEAERDLHTAVEKEWRKAGKSLDHE